MSFESLLIHTCTSGARSGTRNSLGELEYTWSWGTTPIKCRAFPITMAERVQLPGEFNDVRYTVGFLSGAQITTQHRLKFNDKTYQVREVQLDSGGHHKSVLISEVPT